MPRRYFPVRDFECELGATVSYNATVVAAADNELIDSTEGATNPPGRRTCTFENDEEVAFRGRGSE
jgi:hypothetical protein